MPATRSSTPSDALPVIVVGAGIAGLVVARDLAAAGVRVVVLERSERLGGQIDSAMLAGRRVDVGAESFATRGSAVADLLADLGLADHVRSPLDRPAWIHYSTGRSYPLPAAGMLGIPVRPLAREMVAVLGWRGALRAAADAVLPRRSFPARASVGDVVGARMGRTVVERLVDPVVRGVYSSAADSLPLTTASPALAEELTRTRRLGRAARNVRAASPAGSQVNGLDGGLAALVDALAAQVRNAGGTIRTGVEVVSLVPGGLRVRPHDGGAPGSEEEVAGPVVLAAPGIAPGTTREREITVVAAAVRSHRLTGAPRGTGVLVSAGAPDVAARALTHSSAKWSWLAAVADVHLVRLSYDVPPAPEDLERVLECDVRALTGATDAEVLEHVARTWRRTLAVFPDPQADPAGSPRLVGEASGRTGLASIVPHARTVAAELAAAEPLSSSTTSTTQGAPS
ncbi:protoporphyrinogen/coproporphyrinogen oxidase [Serinibacter arcticus]|nr:FAD-dependent oxidoreductase [Serinibacter arcticus]